MSERAGGEGVWHPRGWEEFRWIGEKQGSEHQTCVNRAGCGGGRQIGNTALTTSPAGTEGNPRRKWLWRRGGEPLHPPDTTPGLHPRRLPLSWGKGCSSAWLPWLRNCDEPWERFCLCALRTDFRVKPSTFSEAEMAAALAAPAGGDDDDIAAALALGSSCCCKHGTGSGRRRRRGRGAESSRPSAPSPRPRRPPAPGRRRASPRRRLTATSQCRGFLVPAARPPPGADGGKGGGGGGWRSCWLRARRAGGREPEVWTTEARARGCGRRAPLSSLQPSSPAGRPLSGRCQRSWPCLQPPPEALPSRVPSEPPPRCPLFLPCQRRTLISRGGDPPPRLWARTHSLLKGPSGPSPLPHAPFRRPRRTPSERPLQLEKVEGARRGGGECVCVCARARARGPEEGPRGGGGKEEIDWQLPQGPASLSDVREGVGGGKTCQLPQPIAGLSGGNGVRRGLPEGLLNWEVWPRNGAWLCDRLLRQPIVSEDGEPCAAYVTTGRWILVVEGKCPATIEGLCTPARQAESKVVGPLPSLSSLPANEELKRLVGVWDLRRERTPGVTSLKWAEQKSGRRNEQRDWQAKGQREGEEVSRSSRS